MVLYNKLDVKTWPESDFTSVTTDGITGTIYTNEALSTAKTLTGYTLKIRFLDINGDLVKEDDADIVTAGSGTWRYNPADGDYVAVGIYSIVIELTKSGEHITAIGLNNSNIIRITPS